MIRLIVRRLLLLPVLLLVIYTVTFILAWLVPGNPLEVEGRKPPAAIEDAMKAQYNLDNPFAFYASYLYNATGLRWVKAKLDPQGRPPAAIFDFGPSLTYKDWRVSQIITGALPVSIQLGAAAILAALIIGVTAGVIGAVRRGGAADHATLAIALIGISLPTFVTGSVLLLIFCLSLRWVPVGWGTPQHLPLPTLTLALPFAAYIARLYF